MVCIKNIFGREEWGGGVEPLVPRLRGTPDKATWETAGMSSGLPSASRTHLLSLPSGYTDPDPMGPSEPQLFADPFSCSIIFPSQ